jgi:tRNA A37 methylthiotransferase MiaB
MSSWDWEHFQENVKKIKSVRIQRIYSDKYSIESHTQKAHTGKNRSIASDSDKRENKLLESEGTQAYVLVFLLAFLGGFSAFWSRHRKR